jgi:hypothetical protein
LAFAARRLRRPLRAVETHNPPIPSARRARFEDLRQVEELKNDGLVRPENLTTPGTGASNKAGEDLLSTLVPIKHYPPSVWLFVAMLSFILDLVGRLI